jgi:hypothetical protein
VDLASDAENAKALAGTGIVPDGPKMIAVSGAVLSRRPWCRARGRVVLWRRRCARWPLNTRCEFVLAMPRKLSERLASLFESAANAETTNASIAVTMAALRVRLRSNIRSPLR